MKKCSLILCFFLLTSCTQESAIKNTALRYVVIQFDDQLNKNPDQAAAKKIKSNTKIEATDLKMISDKEAVVTVKTRSLSPENPSQSSSQETQVHLLKENKAWSVQDLSK